METNKHTCQNERCTGGIICTENVQPDIKQRQYRWNSAKKKREKNNIKKIKNKNNIKNEALGYQYPNVWTPDLWGIHYLCLPPLSLSSCENGWRALYGKGHLECYQQKRQSLGCHFHHCCHFCGLKIAAICVVNTQAVLCYLKTVLLFPAGNLGTMLCNSIRPVLGL